MAIDVVARKLEQANEIKNQIREAANTQDVTIPEDAPFADYPGYIAAIPGHLQEKTLTPTAEGVDALPDEEYDGFSRVQIPAEPNFDPKNIAEGISLWGLVGTMDGNMVLMSGGTFTGNGGKVTVAHNLGVIPDLFVAYLTGSALTNMSTTTGGCYIGLSTALKSKLGLDYAQFAAKPRNSTSLTIEKWSYTLDESSSGRVFFQEADESNVYVGSTDYVKTLSAQDYTWLAIGGLT